MSNLLQCLAGSTIHMVGIGGISMSGLCEILLSMVLMSPAPMKKFSEC